MTGPKADKGAGWLGWLRRHGPTVFGLALLVGALYVVQREFRGLSVADIRTAMAALSPTALWIGGGLTVLAYLVLAMYDKLGSAYAGKPVSWPKSLLASFCGYSLAHNLGFAAVSGAAVRYRLYSAWGLTPLEIAKVVGFTSLTFGLGGMALGGLVLMFEPEVVPWFGSHLPHWALQAMAIPLWGIVIAYVVMSRFVRHVKIFKYEIDLPSPRMALMQTMLATVDVAMTAAIFYVLLPQAEGLTFLRFVGIYLASYAVGIAASVPGGLGVFDGAILLGLQPYMPAPEVIGALLVFRLYYYIVPLFIAGGLFVSFELGQRKAALSRLTAFGQRDGCAGGAGHRLPRGACRGAADLPRRAADAGDHHRGMGRAYRGAGLAFRRLGGGVAAAGHGLRADAAADHRLGLHPLPAGQRRRASPGCAARPGGSGAPSCCWRCWWRRCAAPSTATAGWRGSRSRPRRRCRCWRSAPAASPWRWSPMAARWRTRAGGRWCSPRWRRTACASPSA